MSDVATPVQEQVQETQTQVASPDVNQILANSLWGGEPAKQPESVTQPVVEPVLVEKPKEEEVISYDVDEYFRKEFAGLDAAGAKAEWETLRKLKETPATAQEIQWANDESKRMHDLIREGKEDEVYAFLDQKRMLDKLEKYDVTTVSQAAEIIKANLQFKHKELSAQQIDRLYQRQYTMPEQPRQTLDQSDEDYAMVTDSWKKQVQEKEQDMLIDATLAKSELPKYKSQIVLPDIPALNNNNDQQQASQEDLAAQKAFHDNFVQKLATDYRNFKGYSVTAKDGEVELPVSYAISDDENVAFNATVQKAVGNINEFLDNDLGWWDKTTNSFNINKMQEDLYLLLNRGKVFSKIANESAAQRFLHQQKIQNNIRLEGVTPVGGSSAATPAKSESQIVAENIWKL